MLTRRPGSRPLIAALKAAASIVVGVVGFLAGSAEAAVEAHLFQPDQCVACHLFPERRGTFLRSDVMRRDVTTLCCSCHEAERSGVGHRVGMVASMRVPEDFPLDAGGRLTCATCHDPHAVDGPFPDLLRRPPGKAFCDLCHPAGFTPGERTLVSVTFPPEGAVLAPGETVVAGTLTSRSVREVTLRSGKSVTTVPVVGGAFAGSLKLEEGRKGIAVLAGPESALVRIAVRRSAGAWRPHLTADAGQCGVCHASDAATGLFWPEPTAEGCYQCHRRLDRMPRTHRPVALGECTACHDPHGGAAGLVAGGDAGPCLRCHDRNAAAPHVIAANVGLAGVTTRCTGCHDPHQSTRAGLTTSGPASLAVAVELEAPEPVFGAADDGSVSMRGFRTTDDPGRPRLPERLVAVAVPPGADPRSARLRVVSADVAELPGRFRIDPAPPAATWVEGAALLEWGRGRRVRGGKDAGVYGADAAWPPAAVALEQGASLGGLAILRLAYRPIQYNPVRGTVRLTRRAAVEVSFGPAATGVARAAKAGVARAAATARELGVANVARLASWSAGDPSLAEDPLASPAGEGLAAPLAVGEGGADYVVVTTRALADASAGLQEFVAHKAASGFAVRVVTEDDYGDVTGPARAHAVRAWLAANHGALGIRYVLLVGNPHPESGDLPMLRAWPRRGATSNPTYVDAPTDLYFADLSGNWDLDGDGYYGEYAGDQGAGGVDFVPEVYVGRIPAYGDVAALDAVLRKTIAYENEAGDLSWRRSALLPMSFSDASTDGAWLAERMKGDYLLARGFTPWTLYQQGSAGGGDSAFDSDGELRGGVAETRWAAAPAGIVAWWGHGSSSRTTVGYTGAWDGDILAAPVAALDDTAPAFVYQTSCLNGYPELSGNLGYALLRRGAIATVAASRVSWYYVGQTTFAGSASNAGLGYGYVSRLTAGDPAGRALALTKGDPALAIGSDAMWMNLMDFNLYGDPSVGLFRGPLLQLSEPEVVFTLAEGETGPLSEGVGLSAVEGSLPFQALPEAGWLSGAPLTGVTPATIALSAQGAGLTVGDHAAQVLIVSDQAGNSPLALPVTLRVVRPGSVAGRVTSAAGTPIAGATVTLQGPRSRVAASDAAGSYGFGTLPPGSYTVAVSGTGFTFEPASFPVALGEGDAASADFTGGTLELRGRTVRARNGRPIGNVAVQLRTASGVLLRQVRSGADGSYELRRVTPGSYQLRARHRRWRFPKQTVTFSDRAQAAPDFLGRPR